METISIKEILAIARQESEQLNHYYVGVEHLFLALTRIKGGVTAELLEQRGLLGFFLAAIAREAYQKTDEQRYWPDFRITERAQRVLDMTQQRIDGGVSPEDRALLTAILDEGDSLAIRILEEIGGDVPSLREAVTDWTGRTPIAPPLVPIQIDDPAARLDPIHERILRLMFRGADRIFIRRALQDGFSGAMVLLVQAKQTVLNAPVIVKLDDKQAIQYEKLRYDQFVKDILPPNTSIVRDEPTIVPDLPLGGIKYTFVARPDQDRAANMLQYSQENSPQALAKFIRNSLYEPFRHYWWGQGGTVRFQVWTEYELLLPPALIVEIIPTDEATANIRTLYPNGTWSRSGGINVGEAVVLENFVAQKIKPDRSIPPKTILQLSAGAGSEASNRSARVDVRGIDFSKDSFYRGETVKRLVGRVVQTRSDLLFEQVQALEPDFDFADMQIPGSDDHMLPNPLLHFSRVLDRWIEGRLTPIHGDLHTGNILTGPAGDAWLIDFEWTRQGHSLFDWAVLETSLLTDLVVPLLDESWATSRHILGILAVLNRTGHVPQDIDPDLRAAFIPIEEVRRIVGELLASKLWSEYYNALSLVSLRVPSWQNKSLTARRLTYLASALYMDASRLSDIVQSDTDTISRTIADMQSTSKHPD